MIKAPQFLISLAILLWLPSPTQAKADSDALTLFIPISNETSQQVQADLRRAAEAADLEGLIIKTAPHWHDYQQGIRAGRRGIYVAAPHFASWAIHKHDFVPLIRLPGSLSYVVATARSDAAIFEMNDLANQAVCSERPLNLDYLLINRAFDDPMLSANIRVVSSVSAEMLRASSSCRGFSLTDRGFEAVAARFPDRYIRLQQSIKYNNLVLIADSKTAKLRPDLVQAVRSLMTSRTGRRTLEPWLLQWAAQTNWVTASRQHYPRNYMRVLEAFWR